MLRDYFLNKVERAIQSAIKENKLGQMTEYQKGSLPVEKPKNPDFGDFAINVSSLALASSSFILFVSKDKSLLLKAPVIGS